LVVFIQHDPSELQSLKSWTLAKFELSLYEYCRTVQRAKSRTASFFPPKGAIA